MWEKACLPLGKFSFGHLSYLLWAGMAHVGTQAGKGCECKRKHWNKTQWWWAAGRTLSCVLPAVPLSRICCPRTKSCPIWRFLPHPRGFVHHPLPPAPLDEGDSVCPACMRVIVPFGAISAFPHAGGWRGAPLWGGCAAQLAGDNWRGQHRLSVSAKATLGGCWGRSCPLPSSGTAITGWRLLCWAPHRCYSDQPEVSSTRFCHHNTFPSPIGALCSVRGYCDIPTNLHCHPQKTPGSRKGGPWCFCLVSPTSREPGWVKIHVCRAISVLDLATNTTGGRTRPAVSMAITNTLCISIQNQLTIQIVHVFNQLLRVTATKSCWDIWRDFPLYLYKEQSKVLLISGVEKGIQGAIR